MIYEDSVYGSIDLPDMCNSFLELPPLTRLRNIKQLGFTPSVYTGAVHTRFEHTIGKTWVLINLFDQFNLVDVQQKQRYIIASLISEIGVFPFSHSTHWLFAKKMGYTKKYFAEQLFDTYISQIIKFSKVEKQFILNKDNSSYNWLKEKLPSLKIFPDLNLLSLAGDIDYAIRDSHYSGRYSNSFDLRYFRTLVDFDNNSSIENLIESIRELYRSIYSLNSVYGEKTRRFITLIFIRLASFLLEKKYLSFDQYIKASEFVDLDDDKFMAILKDSSDTAINDGFYWVKTMIDYVEQLNSVDIEKLEFPDKLSNLSLTEIEEFIAKERGVEKRLVIAISDNKENILDYVLFGKRFKCYQEAIESDYFKNMTGLFSGSNRTNLMDTNSIFYTIIK